MISNIDSTDAEYIKASSSSSSSSSSSNNNSPNSQSGMVAPSSSQLHPLDPSALTLHNNNIDTSATVSSIDSPIVDSGIEEDMMRHSNKERMASFQIVSEQQRSQGNQQQYGIGYDDDDDVEEGVSGGDHTAPPQQATPETAAMLLIADIVGSGILGLGYSFAKLGWVLGFLSGAMWLPFNIYAGLLLLEIKLEYKNAHTFADLAGAVLNNSLVAKVVVGTGVYLFILAILGNYLLIMSESMQNMFVLSIPDACKYAYSIISSFMLIPVIQYRTLNATWRLLVVNIITLFAAIAVSVGSLVVVGVDASLASKNGKREMIASDLTFMSFFQAQAMFAFAYSGTILYLEIMSEMRDVREFRKSLAYYGGPFQLTSYLFTGSVTYYFLGNAAIGMLTSMIAKDAGFVLANLFLFVHVLIAFVIKMIVVSRAIHKVVSPSSVNDFESTGRGAKVWFLITLLVLLFCFILSNAVPMFSDLASFLGAFLSPWSGFFFPIFLVLKMRRDKDRPTSRREWALIVFLLVFNILLFVCGTYEGVITISQSTASGKGAFSCVTADLNAVSLL